MKARSDHKKYEGQVIVLGHFQETIEVCVACERTIIGIIDSQLSGDYRGFQVLGGDSDAQDIYGKHSNALLIVSVDSPTARKRLVNDYSKIGFSFGRLIHPEASVSSSASLGEGVIILSGVNISANVVIGGFVLVNTCANIAHDVIIGAYSTIAPNAVLLGKVVIEEDCYIGANSTILPNVTIHRRAVVGAGAVVTKSVDEGKTVVGNPARPLA
jgi:sugar O-acyltransferase (sialic acid O-acetyltransferase NeuD family)